MNRHEQNGQTEFLFRQDMIGDQHIGTWKEKAGEYVGDREKTENLLDRAMRKAENNKKNDAIKIIWNQILLLFSLLRDWTSGSYRHIAKSSIALIIAGLLYFVSPIDFVPDWIVGLGIFDDAAVLGLIINQLNKELQRYKEWKELQGM